LVEFDTLQLTNHTDGKRAEPGNTEWSMLEKRDVAMKVTYVLSIVQRERG